MVWNCRLVTLAQFGAGLDSLLQRHAVLDAPSTSTATLQQAVTGPAAAGPQLVSTAAVRGIPESSSEEGGMIPPSGVLFPSALATPAAVTPTSLPLVQRRVKRARRPRKKGAKGTSGLDQVSQSVAQPAGAVVPSVSFPQTTTVALRHEHPSTSSAEDPLPVPARASQGGKRRRKKCSQRHSKKCKVDTSSSSTTGSSTSSDESDASLGLYWGFGELDLRLPRWAWARRANSHRARYGAVQECLNGELVPETRVSTNSARDLIPGSHLSSKLRSRILNGRYVDLFDLAPPEDYIPVQGKLSLPKKRDTARKVERTFERWLDCFQVFSGVVVAAYPRRALHMIVYQSIVRSAFTMAGEAAAIAYDEQFRRRAAKIETARWDRKDLDVWTTYVVPSVERRPIEQQKSKTSAFKASNGLRCWDFNKGLCLRQPCGYAHICERCGGTHPATSCFGGRRPFCGGKGAPNNRRREPSLPFPPPSSPRFKIVNSRLWPTLRSRSLSSDNGCSPILMLRPQPICGTVSLLALGFR
nr:uncharacterized protein LOC118076098 [Zootoca vivipara]